MSDPEVERVADRLADVESKIDTACRTAGRSREQVHLVAVSKRQPIERVQAAYDAGQRVFGENYAQELEVRSAELPGDARWHMIGHLQRNKAKKIADRIECLHTLDSAKLARALAKSREGGTTALAVLLQVNIDLEDSKSGLAPQNVEPLIQDIRELEGIELRGLMTIPRRGEGRRWFAALRELRDQLAASTGLALSELSMGMSGDFEDAIAEGATWVRIGTQIFGPRTD